MAANILAALLALAWAVSPATAADDDPLKVEVRRLGPALELSFRLVGGLPSSFVDAIPSGAQVRVVYPIKVRSQRRLLWNRKVWDGEVVSRVAFDPVTGRYQCELILDSVIVESVESSSAEEAGAWLAAPPAVRLSIPFGRRQPDLTVRVRAVFSSSTKWLFFPAVEGTEWVEVAVEPR
jgi:hypothetical protein